MAERPPPRWEQVLRTCSVGLPSCYAGYELPAAGVLEEGWVAVPASDYDLGQLPRLLAIDCEMCTTTTEQKALLKVSAVDAQGNVLIDSMVLPEGEVTDYKTSVTGITAADLEGVTLSRAGAQRDLLAKMGSPGTTVLVGHSLPHDLRALRMACDRHVPVIDTSVLFRYEGLPTKTPSLAQLCATVLKRPIREEGSGSHDPLEDARAAMELALWAVSHTDGFPVEVKAPGPQLGKLQALLESLLVASGTGIRAEESNKQVLVQIVKESQRQRVAGTEGEWKAFRAARQHDLGDSSGSNDPSRQSVGMLSAFAQTLLPVALGFVVEVKAPGPQLGKLQALLESLLVASGTGITEESNKQVLVQIVKESQRQRVAGTEGEWKAFRAARQHDLGDSSGSNDPSRQSLGMLSAFARTLLSVVLHR